jgi:hypothetical protein
MPCVTRSTADAQTAQAGEARQSHDDENAGGTPESRGEGAGDTNNDNRRSSTPVRQLGARGAMTPSRGLFSVTPLARESIKQIKSVPSHLADGLENLDKNKANWAVWRRKIGLILESCGLDEYAYGELVDPISDPSNHRMWLCNDRLARSFLILHCSDAEQELVNHITSSAGVLEFLRKRHCYNRSDHAPCYVFPLYHITITLVASVSYLSRTAEHSTYSAVLFLLSNRCTTQH